MSSRIELFGVPMDVMTMEQTISEIDRRLSAGTFTQHVVVNVAKVVQMQQDKELAAAVTACDIINIDGAGVIFGGRLLGKRIPERVTGIDLFGQLLAYAERAGRSVYLLGAEPDVIEKTVQVIRNAHPELCIAGYHHGYFWKEEARVVEEIRRSGAEMLFVGIASPLKEQFINRWRDQLGVLFAMGVGGSFDVVSGKILRAPLWMQRIGLEWLFRVLQEPRRLWKRYLITNTVFVTMLVREKWKGAADTARMPGQ